MRLYLQTPNAISECVCMRMYIFLLGRCTLLWAILILFSFPGKRALYDLGYEFFPAPAVIMTVDLPYLSILISKYKPVLAIQRAVPQQRPGVPSSLKERQSAAGELGRCQQSLGRIKPIAGTWAVTQPPQCTCTHVHTRTKNACAGAS